MSLSYSFACAEHKLIRILIVRLPNPKGFDNLVVLKIQSFNLKSVVNLFTVNHYSPGSTLRFPEIQNCQYLEYVDNNLPRETHILPCTPRYYINGRL